MVCSQKVSPEGRTIIRVGDYSVPWNPHFRLVLATKLSPAELAPDLHSALLLVNFRVTPASLEEQLLHQIIIHETPHLEEQRTALVMSMAKDMELKAAIQEKILAVRRRSAAT